MRARSAKEAIELDVEHKVKPIEKSIRTFLKKIQKVKENEQKMKEEVINTGQQMDHALDKQHNDLENCESEIS